VAGKGEIFEFDDLYEYDLVLVNIIDQGLFRVSQKKCSLTISQFFVSLFSTIDMGFMYIPFYTKFTPQGLFLSFF
jgi:hypothetical protein